MLKTTGSSIISAFRINDNEVIGGRGIVCGSDVSRKLTKSKNWTKNGHLGNSNNMEKPKFLISKAKKVFNHLK